MRFRIGESTYETTSMDAISLKDLVLFNTQAADLGIPERWADVERIMNDLEQLTEAEAEVHPDKFLVMAVTVWIARRSAGDVVTFAEAIDVPLSQMVIIPDPQDHAPGKSKGAKQPRKASAAAASRPVRESVTTPAATESGSQSTPD